MQRRLMILAFLLGATIFHANTSTLSWAQNKAKTKTKKKPIQDKYNVQTWTLNNGLQIAFLPMPKAPSVTVQLWYHVGSKNEESNRRGSAHMFEHMMFKGTQHVRAEAHMQFLSALGGTMNAFTTEDATAYHNTLPPNYLDFAIQLEAERMQHLWFRDGMIAAEKEVVKEEIRQQENSPLYRGFLRFLSIAYQVHPYSWTAGGTLKDLDATSTKDLESFYQRFYVPNNALLVIVGNVQLAEVKASAEKWFGSVAKGTQGKKPIAPKEPKQNKTRREIVEKAQVGVIMRGYHIPEAKHPDIHALRVLALILSGGESSRLFQQIVKKDKLAVQAGGQLLVREDPGLFVLFGAFLQADMAKNLESALAKQISLLQKSFVSNKELRKAKNQIMAQLAFGLESVTGIANQIGTSWIQRGDPKMFMEDMSAIEKVTAADIKRVAKFYFNDAQATVVIIPPLRPKAGGAK